MNGLLGLLLGPVLAAGVTLLLGRWRRPSLLTGVLFLPAWAGWVLAQPADETWLVYGRALRLTAGDQQVLALLALLLALLFLLTGIRPSGPHFVSGSLLALALLAAAFVSELFLYGSVALVSAWMLLAGVAQAGRPGEGHVAARFLTFALLSLPFFLMGGRLLGNGQVTLLAAAGGWLLVGALLLLAGFPFQIWVTPLVRKAPLPVTILLLGWAQTALAAFLLPTLAGLPWPPQTAPWPDVLLWSGVLTMGVGGILAATAVSVGRWLGGLLLLDMGVTGLALLLPPVTGLAPALIGVLARFAGMFMWVLGLHLLTDGGAWADVSWERMRGLGRIRPWGAALFIAATISLFGLPLTIGFYGRWRVLTTALASADGGAAALTLAAIGLAGVGVLRWLLTLMEPGAERENGGEGRPLWLRGGIGLLLAGWVFASFFPHFWIEPVSRLALLLTQ